MRSECKEAFLREAARLEYSTYWDEKNDRPEAVLLQCHWSWFQVAWQHRQTEVDEANAKASMCRDEKNHAIKRWGAIRQERDELQKRVDAVKQLIEDYKDPSITSDKTFHHGLLTAAYELEQALNGGLTPNLNTDENGECRHFSTTLFADGKAECFHCDAVVNEEREVIGKQSKGLHPFFQKESK